MITVFNDQNHQMCSHARLSHLLVLILRAIQRVTSVDSVDSMRQYFLFSLLYREGISLLINYLTDQSDFNFKNWILENNNLEKTNNTNRKSYIQCNKKLNT